VWDAAERGMLEHPPLRDAYRQVHHDLWAGEAVALAEGVGGVDGREVGDRQFAQAGREVAQEPPHLLHRRIDRSIGLDCDSPPETAARRPRSSGGIRHHALDPPAGTTPSVIRPHAPPRKTPRLVSRNRRVR
jgi:hypothetical protein